MSKEKPKTEEQLEKEREGLKKTIEEATATAKKLLEKKEKFQAERKNEEEIGKEEQEEKEEVRAEKIAEQKINEENENPVVEPGVAVEKSDEKEIEKIAEVKDEKIEEKEIPVKIEIPKEETTPLKEAPIAEKEVIEEMEEKDEELVIMLTPEQVEEKFYALEEIENKFKKSFEETPLSSRFKQGVINGIEKWENFGKGEEGVKGFAKRFSKMAVNLALIGAISSVSVEKLAQAGIGTASALSGGVTSYLGRKLAIGLGMGSALEVGSKKISEKVKKWMPLALGVAGVGAAVVFSGGLAGVAAGLSAGAGYASSKLIKGRFTSEKIAAEEEKAKQMFWEHIKEQEQDNKMDEQTVNKLEDDYRKLLNKYENKKIWGKLLDGATKILVGSVVSGVSMEASGMVHDHVELKHEQDLKHEQELKNENYLKPEQEIKEPNLRDHLKEHDLKDQIEERNKELMHQQELKHEQEIKEQEFAKQQATINNDDIIVHKGEGIESAFIRQIENNHDLAKELGFKGDINDAKALHEFAGREAHIIAIKEGYVDGAGHEVRVMEADKMGYEIKVDNGHIIVDEKIVGDGIIETHHEGDAFEHAPDKGEYIHNLENKIDHTLSGESSHENVVAGASGNNQPETDHGASQSTSHESSNNTASGTERTHPALSEQDSKIVHNTIDDNINRLFPSEKLMGEWSQIKNNITAERFMEMYNKNEIDTNIRPDIEPLINYIHKLEEITGLHPYGESPLHPNAESIPHFIGRAVEEAQVLGKLDQVKL